jgi:PncC family amidohydrolase
MSGPAVPCPSKGSAPLEQRLFDLLVGRDVTVAAAESCTGGNIGHRITLIPGCSEYFVGSLVTYSNAAKIELLGVPPDVIESVGAVSEECARAMAGGARKAYHAVLAVSTTGIAGPGGATDRKPVGLVYIGVSSPAGTNVERHVFPGDRLAVIDAATERALELLVDAAEHYLESNER